MAAQFNPTSDSVGQVHQRLPGPGRPPALHARLLPPDRVLHVLLRLDHLQPRRGRGQHEEVRRLHPRDPGGKPTEDYLAYVLSRITPGALYLGLISLIPLIAFVVIDANQNFLFGGTSILIMVGVALDTVKQIESQLSSATTKDSCADEPPHVPEHCRSRGVPGHAADHDGARPGRARAHRPSTSPSTSGSPRSRPATSSGPTSRRERRSGSRPRASWTPATTCPTRSPT